MRDILAAIAIGALLTTLLMFVTATKRSKAPKMVTPDTTSTVVPRRADPIETLARSMAMQYESEGQHTGPIDIDTFTFEEKVAFFKRTLEAAEILKRQDVLDASRKYASKRGVI